MQDQVKSFFASLIDMSFTSLISTKIIKVLYVLSLIGIGLSYLFWVIVAMVAEPGFGVLVLLIIGPVAVLFSVILSRVFLEGMIAVFRIMETNIEIASRQGSGLSSTPEQAPTVAQPPPPSPGTQIA